MSDSNELAQEYASIKAYCRKEAAKSFKHPLAPKEQAPEEKPAEPADLSDAELDSLLSE